ncbi:MAG: tryptophan 7-halogenase [Acidobacteriota bacterium]|nr:tryptophan 7-halogenase [Acidobacteriota bacterium]
MAASHQRPVIVGGGPAGATAARLLALWGHEPLVLTRDRAADRSIAESVPPSCRRLFRHIAIEESFASAGFQPTTGNTVWWGSPEARVEWFPAGETGWQVRSSELESLLLRLASDAGAEVLGGRTVREVEGGRVLCTSGAEAEVHETDWVLDASGRSGVVARAGLRRPFESAATLALAATWETPKELDLADPSHTLVESYADGWAWSVPVSAAERFVAVMVDPRLTSLAAAAGSNRDGIYDGELAKTRALGPLLSSGRRLSEVLACDASCYSASAFAGPGFLLLGDAGSFIDPLSSYGVKKAISSGWLAAVCLRTLLEEEDLTEACLELYDRRERQVFESYRRLSSLHFGEGGGAEPGRFWTERSMAAVSELHEDDLRFDPAILREDADVLAAFAELKQREAITLRVAPAVSVEPRAMVEGDRVVLADHLVGSWAPDGIRYLRDVELPRLATAGRCATSVPALFDAYNAAGVEAALPDFLGALSVGLAKGLLIDEE